jgi:nitrilase
MLVDPWGVIVDRLPRGPGVVAGAIDPQQMARLRQSLPALAHRIFG